MGAFGPSAGFFVAAGAGLLANGLAPDGGAAVLAAPGSFACCVGFVLDFAEEPTAPFGDVLAEDAFALALVSCCLLADWGLVGRNVVSVVRVSDFGLACARARSSAAGADFAAPLFGVAAFAVGAVLAGARAVTFAALRDRPAGAAAFVAAAPEDDLLAVLAEAGLVGADLVEDAFTDAVLLEDEAVCRADLVVVDLVDEDRVEGDRADDADFALLADLALLADVPRSDDLALATGLAPLAAEPLVEAALVAVDPVFERADNRDRAEEDDRAEEGARLVLAVADVGLVGMAHSFVGPGGDGPHGTRRGRMRT